MRVREDTQTHSHTQSEGKRNDDDVDDVKKIRDIVRTRTNSNILYIYTHKCIPKILYNVWIFELFLGLPNQIGCIFLLISFCWFIFSFYSVYLFAFFFFAATNTHIQLALNSIDSQLKWRSTKCRIFEKLNTRRQKETSRHTHRERAKGKRNKPKQENSERNVPRAHKHTHTHKPAPAPMCIQTTKGRKNIFLDAIAEKKS